MDLPLTSPPSPRARRRAALVLVVGLLVLVTGAAGAWAAWNWHLFQEGLRPVGAGPEVTFQVRSGEGLATIAARLVAAGLVRDARWFRLQARRRGLEHRLQAGWYRLSPGTDVDGLLGILAAGKVATRRVTLPEGLNLKECAARAEEAGLGPAAEYLRLATERAAEFGLKGLPAGAALEGYLFPETYQLPLDAGPRELIAAQVERFVAVWGELTAGPQAPARPRHEVVTIASIIEKEAKADEERPKVAGVIENRLRRGMKLEMCSTVLYALGEHRARLLYRDLGVVSPYNTYLVKGLPPGPIASPGRPSLEAALHPAEHDDLYFVLAADGRHLFGRSAAEHERNRVRARKLREEP